MSDSLFRKEVLEARQSRWLGGISLGQPVPLWVLCGCAIAIAAAVVVFLTFGEYTRRTRVVGQLVPTLGLANVSAPAAGTLSQVRVEEGEHVLAGQVLAVVTVPRATLAGGDTNQALEQTLEQRRTGTAAGFASQRQQLEAQQAGVLAQASDAQGELAQIEAELNTRRRQQQLADETLARYKALRVKQYVTDLQVQQQESVALEQLSQVQALERQALAARRLLAQLNQANHELPAQIAALSAAEQRDSASLSQESLETKSKAEAVIQAPVSGTITALLGQPGQAVQPGQTVLSMLPAASNLEAQLLVPSRAVGFISPGDTVLLRYQAYPYQKFGHYGGHVAQISRSALSSGELGTLIGNADAGEPYYRVIVSLDQQSVHAYGKDEPLKPGLLLEADILGEHRKLWEWAFEPLYTLTGRIETP